MAERMSFILDGRDQLTPVFRRIGESADRFHQRLNNAVEQSGGELRAFSRTADGQLRLVAGSMEAAGRAADGLGQEAAEAAPAVQSVGEAAQEAAEDVQRFTRDSNGRLHDLRGRFVAAAAAAEELAREAAAAVPPVLALGQAAEEAGEQVEQFTRDANGRLRDLRGRFIAAREESQNFGDSVAGITPSLDRLGEAAEDAAEDVGSEGGGLGGAMKAVAGVAALSLLPALGAMVPMMVGMQLASKTLTLGFSGVSDALKAAEKGQKEYAEATKKMTPEAKTFTDQLLVMKAQFGGLAKDIQKVMLPGFTQALKDAQPIVRMLGRGMTEMGRGFGEAARGVGKLLNDSGFKADLAANMRLGTLFMKDMTSGLGRFVQALLHFGAVSEPTLKAFSTGISGLLGDGLPGMFKGLERGIEGTSKFLSGLFSLLNSLLPAIGRFSGEIANAFGPILGEMATLAGKHMAAVLDLLGTTLKWMSPVIKDFAFGIKSIGQILGVIAPVIRDTAAAILGSFLPSFEAVDKARFPMQRLSQSIERNKIQLMDMARVGGDAVIGMVTAVLTHLPNALHMFNLFSGGALTALSALVHGAAVSFGWIPGIGDKLRKADSAFQGFKNNYVRGLSDAERKTRQFSQSVLPKLAQNRLQMNISNWERQISAAKGQLRSVPASKRADLLARISDLQAKAARARAELASIRNRTVKIDVWTHYRQTGSPYRPPGQDRARGGLLRGPGTGTSDSIPVNASDGEYVVQASAVDRVGVRFLDALNDGRLGAMLPTLAAQGGATAHPAVQAPTSGMVVNISVQGAIDPIAVAQQMRKLFLKLQRDYGLQDGVIMR